MNIGIAFYYQRLVITSDVITSDVITSDVITSDVITSDVITSDVITSDSGGPPSVPSSFVITKSFDILGANQINAGWSIVSDATSYKLYTGQTTDITATPYNVTYTTSDLDYIYKVSRLSASSDYSYAAVTAVNSDGESSKTSQESLAMGFPSYYGTTSISGSIHSDTTIIYTAEPSSGWIGASDPVGLAFMLTTDSGWNYYNINEVFFRVRPFGGTDFRFQFNVYTDSTFGTQITGAPQTLITSDETQFLDVGSDGVNNPAVIGGVLNTGNIIVFECLSVDPNTGMAFETYNSINSSDQQVINENLIFGLVYSPSPGAKEFFSDATASYKFKIATGL